MSEPLEQIDPSTVGTATEAPDDGTAVVARTAQGLVRGRWNEGIARFAGIPFAAPPIGDRRFRPPAPPEPWDGERDATEFGSVCPQNPSMMDLLFGGEGESWSEDCLFLNVWTPATSPLPTSSTSASATAAPTSMPQGGGLPVMVWIHGGGFEMGSGSSPLYHGDSFARDGVVYVSLNYRLGSLGFLELGHVDAGESGSGNVGILDQIAALEWVRDNISAFGGDPSQVTVFGESAGAMSISLLLASPRTKGLFTRAIAQSGAASSARPPTHAHRDADEFMGVAGVSTVEELRALPVEDLLVAHAAVSGARMGDPGTTFREFGNPLAFLAFRPVVDGDVVPADPIGAIEAGSAQGVSLMVGTNLEEWKLFSIGSTPPADEEALLARIGVLLEDPGAALDAYMLDFPGATPPDLECAIMTDMVFRSPAERMASAQVAHGPVFQYRFDWPSQVIGAAHAVEIPFVFDMVADHRLHVLLGPDAPAQLAEEVHSAWVSFARSATPASDGLPDWIPTTAGSRVVQVLATPSAVMEDPMPSTTEFWNREPALKFE